MKRVIALVVAVVVVLGLVSVAALSHAATTSYPASAATYVWAGAPTSNFDGAPVIAGSHVTYRALLSFDTSNVPADATVSDVSLTIDPKMSLGGSYQVHPEVSFDSPSVTWDNQPEWQSTVIGSAANTGTDNPLTIDIPSGSFYLNVGGVTSLAVTFSTPGVVGRFAGMGDAGAPSLNIAFSGDGGSTTATTGGSTTTSSPTDQPTTTTTTGSSTTTTTGSSAGSSTTTTTTGQAGNSLCGTMSGQPTTSKVMVIAEENHSAGAIIGSGAAPYINSLANECGLATNYSAINHPSLPNYMALTSGLQYGAPWTSDCDAGGACLTTNNSIFQQVPNSKGYAESMAGNCQFNSSGDYATKHNPFPYYSGVSGACATNDVPLGTASSGALASDVAHGTLPTYSFVTPNLQDDMHDGTIQQGDNWLKSWIPQITSGPDYQAGHLTVIITWDEGEGGSNQVATIVISPFTPAGTQSAAPFTHYSTLKAAEDVAGVPELNNAASAANLRTAFGF